MKPISDMNRTEFASYVASELRVVIRAYLYNVVTVFLRQKIGRDV